MKRYLYRRVNPEMYQSRRGRLEPKAIGKSFKGTVKYGQGFKYGEVTYGSSTKNTVVGHQRIALHFHRPVFL
jgi:hypothetical protein